MASTPHSPLSPAAPADLPSPALRALLSWPPQPPLPLPSCGQPPTPAAGAGALCPGCGLGLTVCVLKHLHHAVRPHPDVASTTNTNRREKAT